MFLCSTVLYSIRFYFHHQTHIELSVISALAQGFILSEVIRNYPSMPPQLDFFWPGGLIFWCHIFLPFHTVHGVLVARILEWIAIPPPVGQILSELFTVTHLSWVTLQGMTQNFIELFEPLHKVVINEGRHECTIYFAYLWIFKLHCFALTRDVLQ